MIELRALDETDAKDLILWMGEDAFQCNDGYIDDEEIEVEPIIEEKQPLPRLRVVT